MKGNNTKENRTARVSGRITPALLRKVAAMISKNKWTVSDAIEEALTRLVRS